VKIAVDFTPAIQRHAGIGRYAEELARALVALRGGPDPPRQGDEIRLFYTDPQGRLPAPPLDALPRQMLRWANKPWRMRVLLSSYARLPMDSLLGDADVFHATDHLLPPLRRVHSVFTLYDLSFLKYPETHLPLNRWFSRLMMPLFLRRAGAVISISQHTKADAVRYYGLDESKIHVIPLGVDSRFHPAHDRAILATVRARYHLPDRFILSVGTIEPRKNLLTLLRAYERLRATADGTHRLVLVGTRGWRAEQFLAALASSPVRHEVVLAGPVPDVDLPLVYGAADLFVYPSLYEGFGLPPLEAMACGVPVIASSAASLPEVVGDAGLLVDPHSAEELAAAMRRVLGDETLRGALRMKGLARASSFSWSETARRTYEVYQDVYYARAEVVHRA